MYEIVWAFVGFLGGIFFSIFGLMFSRSRDHYKEGTAKEGSLSFVFARFWGKIDQLMFTPIAAGGVTDVRDFDKTIIKVGPRITRVITFRKLFSTWFFGISFLMMFSVLVAFFVWTLGSVLAPLLSLAAILMLLYGTIIYMLLFETASTEHNFQIDPEKFIWDARLLHFDDGYTLTESISSIKLMDGFVFVRFIPFRKTMNFPARVLTVRDIHGEDTDIFALPRFLNDRFGDPMTKLHKELCENLEEVQSELSSTT